MHYPFMMNTKNVLSLIFFVKSPKMGIRIQIFGKTPNKMENGTWIGYKENLTRHTIQKCFGISGHWSFTLSLLVKDFVHTRRKAWCESWCMSCQIIAMCWHNMFIWSCCGLNNNVINVKSKIYECHDQCCVPT